MSTYRGPHVEVKQVFEVSPGAVAIENLPPSLIGTAYDVYTAENLVTANGITDSSAPWPDAATKVIYDEDVAGKRVYDFYPPRAFIDVANLGGEIDLDKEAADITTDGIALDVATADTISTSGDIGDVVVVPDTEMVAGSCSAIMPYYAKHNCASPNFVQIIASNLQEVVIPSGAVLTSKIKFGQKVYISIDGGTNYTLVGQVGIDATEEGRIKLIVPYSAAITNGTDIVIGSADSTATLIGKPNTLYDPNADFISAKVAPGDVVAFSSLSLSGTTTLPLKTSAKRATVTSVTRNTLTLNTDPATSGAEEFVKFKCMPAVSVVNTITIYSYWVERYVGFSQNYGLATLGAGVFIANVTTTSFTIHDTFILSSSSPSPSYSSSPSRTNSASPSPTPSPSPGLGDAVPPLLAGDYIEITATNALATTKRHIYKIDSITYDAGTGLYTINTIETMVQGGTTSTAIANHNYLHAWHPYILNDILADFRSIRTEEMEVVKRITSTQDIADAWTKDGIIDVHNELAYMALIAFSTSGGRVLYGANVDSSSSEIAASYAEALEAMKLVDCYTTVFGTTNGGINALMASYVDGQSDPYEAHERVGIVTYDERDVFLQGTETGNATINGLITIGGSLNLLTAGVTVKDTVEVYDSNGVYVETLNVIATPTVSNQVQTDGVAVRAAGHSFKFMCGRADAQSILIGALGSGNRRVKTLWPGWFSADVSGTTYTLPPYYIAAARAGDDCSIIVSQSMTNYTI